MGQVVQMGDYRPKETIDSVDQAILDSFGAAGDANEACGFMSMRLYQMGVKTTDLNAMMDMDVIRFLTLGLLERTQGQVTDNTLLLDTLRLHFQLDDVTLVGVANEEG